MSSSPATAPVADAPAAPAGSPGGSADGPPPRRPRLYYGWVMLPVAALLHAGTGAGQTYGVSVFNPFIREDLGISGLALSSTYAYASFLAALPLSLVGRLTDRFGLRAVGLGIVAGLTGGCFLIAAAPGLVVVGLGFFALRLLGQGALTLVASNTPAMWFARRLGLAGGLAGLGPSVAFAALPTAYLWTVRELEWRDGYRAVGLATAAVLLPVLFFVYRNRPADVGQYLDGDRPDDDAAAVAKRKGRGPADDRPSLSAKRAYRTPAFWTALCVQSLWGMIGTALIFHLASLFEARGLPDPEADAAFALGVFAVAMAAAQFLAGVLADRTAAGNLLAVFGALAAAGCGSLFLIESRPGAWAFAATLGAGQGTLSAGMNVLWPRFFGTAALGAIRGTVQTFSAAACAAGPVLVSLSREHAGGEGPALAGFCGLLLAAGIAGLFLKPPERPAAVEDRAAGE